MCCLCSSHIIVCLLSPEMQSLHGVQIPDDINTHLGVFKYDLSFAGGGPNTRSTQLFIAYEDLDFLGKAPWEVCFGDLECSKFSETYLSSSSRCHLEK